MKKIEVKNFKLYTTAVICIEWKGDLLNVNLDLAMMLKMMKMEGLTEADIIRFSQQGQPIPFTKVTLVLFQEDNKPGQYCTDESFDEDDVFCNFENEGEDCCCGNCDEDAPGGEENENA